MTELERVLEVMTNVVSPVPKGCCSTSNSRGAHAWACSPSAPLFSSTVSAQAASRSCTTPVTSAPTGPATVSTASTSFGRVLIVGSGANAGCSLYVLTSDQLHSLTFGLSAFACSNGPNAIGQPCDSVLWPALLTRAPRSPGPGVKHSLLGTVTRTDVLSGASVQQVTYAGLPLYRFFLDETPGQTDGANLFDPVTSPAGTWYLVQPGSGNPAPGRLAMQSETVGGSEVLSASMDNDFSLLPHGDFPVYTLSNDNGQACEKFCALIWSPGAHLRDDPRRGTASMRTRSESW